jgi:DNA-binding beta-propeller fold protein YncE
VLISIGLVGVVAATLRKPGQARPPATTAASVARARRPVERVLMVRAARVGTLSEPLHDAAGAPASPTGSVATLLAGLSASDTSTSAVRVADAAGDRTTGQLPRALHDAAAAYVGTADYLFGGGDGVAQHAEIYRVDASRGVATHVADLPAASSDQSAATVGGTAYIVGGYTGSRWLDTVVAFRAPHSVRVVAHLPVALRYAAVTAVGADVIIAGGSLADGSASREVYRYRPGGGVRAIGRLPAATTHAAALAADGYALVVGGRGARSTELHSSIVAIDPRNGRTRLVGRLPQPLSDETAVAGGRLLLFGGRGAAGTTDAVVRLTTRLVRVAGRARRRSSARALDVYAADGAGMLTGAARFAIPRIYVPNSLSDTVDEIDPRTMKIVKQFAVGSLPQHVVPAYDLRTLYVTNDNSNNLTPIDPRTGRPGRSIPVADPYNMYFTPDGRFAIVVAERLHRLDFRDAHTFKLHRSVHVPCAGVDHIDFSADGSYLIASCEFSGQLVKVNVAKETLMGALSLPDGASGMPQDVKLSPDGRIFYVADMRANGVWEVNGSTLHVIGFLRTGAGTHGLYPSRDSRFLYVSNRAAGTVSVVSFRTRRIVATWRIPGGSPDMGGVSADGSVLWLSGRYNREVYAISTRSGRLLARIPVGSGPHGLCVWPQPGRYSLGHTGILR